MHFSHRGKWFLNLLVLVGLLLSPLQSALGREPAATDAGPMAQTGPTLAVEPSGLYRTTITLRSPTDRARLEKLGVVVLADEGRTTEDENLSSSVIVSSSIVVLADDEQLEALARLRFEPRGSDDLGLLISAQEPEKGWLKTSLGPLLAKAVAMREAEALTPGPSPAGGEEASALAAARADLRAALRALTADQIAGLASLPSIDDDADGLTNTEEVWWCTDPMNPNSDGDAQRYTDGREVRALLDFTLPRNVRWGYGPPFGPPNAWPNFNDRNGTHVNVCNDGDWDTIPDYAEAYMVGTRVPEESTDRDKFDDGQELFGITFCPGAPTNCGYGSYPAVEYWNFIQARVPDWVLPPGDNPLVAAFPVPEVYVTPGSWRVERVTTITTSEGQMTQTSHTYETSVTRGQSSSIADTVTWNNWEEVSHAIETPLVAAAMSTSGAQTCEPAGSLKCRVWGGVKIVGGILGLGLAGLACTSLVGCTVGGVAAIPLSKLVEGGWSDLTNKNQVQMNYPINTYKNTNVANASASAQAQASATVVNNIDFQGVVNSLDGIQYALNRQGELLARGLYDISYQLSRPRYTETRTNGRSWGGAQTTTHEEYEEHTIAEGQAFTTGQNWSTAWAVDSSRAAELTFEFTVKNTGTEYARELTGIVINVYIGDDTSPSISYPAWQKFPNGKLENLFPVGPNTPPGQFSTRTFTTDRIPLSLEQMKRIDLGERLTVKVESYSFGADELFYRNAVQGGVTVFIEDGVEDGDESVDSYVIPTWGVESVQDVLTRYFRCPPDKVCTDADGNLNALWTPEFDGVNPPTWREHYLSDIAWWNVYFTQADAGDTPLKDLPAQAGSAILFRFNRDSDRDGYNDRAEFRYYCALPADHPDRPRCADAHLRPEVHPQPEVAAGYVAERSGNVVTVKLAVANTGTFDAYGIDAVMYSPDSTTTIGNNTVGGNGRVRPGHQVAVGSLIQPPDLRNWGASTAKPYAGGQFTGAADRTFTFTAETAGVVGQGNTSVRWSDGAGGGGVIPLGSSYRAPLPVDVAQGLQVGFNTGTIMPGARFTVQALTPRDTFTYTINSEPFTPPVIVVSYSDPQGSHRFVTPVELSRLDAAIPAGQMLEGLKLEVVTPAPFNPSGANTTHLVVNSPHPATIQGGRLYLNFVSDGKLVLEKAYTLDIPPGPTVFPAEWSVAEFSADYHPNGDNLLIAFWTDSEGNIIDSAARPLSSFQEDPRPLFVADEGGMVWDFGAAQQGALLKRRFSLANTGFGDLKAMLVSSGGRWDKGVNSLIPNWIDTGITVQNGEAVGIRAGGTACYGNNGTSLCYGPAGRGGSAASNWLAPGLPELSLVAKIGDGAPFFAGAYTVVTADRSGRLYLATNDCNGCYADNGGSYQAHVEVYGLPVDGSRSMSLAPGDAGSFDLLINTAYLPEGPFERTLTVRTSDPDHPTRTLTVRGTVTAYTPDTPPGSLQRPLDWSAYFASGTQGQWAEFTHTLGPTPQTLHPVKVWSQDYGRLWGVGKYATPFGANTAPADMFGDGRDGVMPSSGNLDYNNGVGVGIVNSGSAGSYYINVTDVYAVWRINPGDVVLIHQTQGSGAGCWELNKAVSDFGGGTATYQLAQPLRCNYASGGNNHAQIQRVPQYTDCPVSGTVTPLAAWNGSWGGIFAVMCRGTMNVTGNIMLQGYGYRGGGINPYPQDTRPGYQGEGTTGPGAQSQAANSNGGGGGNMLVGCCTSGGGGGGNGTAGTNGINGTNGQSTAYGGTGGNFTGSSELATMVFGGGGGSGSGGWSGEGHQYARRGGNGGGIAFISASNLVVAGTILASGNDGEPRPPHWYQGGGGGGAGGSVFFRTQSATLGVNAVRAVGGTGTPTSDSWNGGGGTGGVGRIRIEYCETPPSGSTNPPASVQKLNCYIAEQVESAPYDRGRLNLPETFSGGRTYQVQYGRRFVFGAAGEQTAALRVPAAAFTSATLDALISEVGSGSLTFRLDIGNDGSWDWEWTGNVNGSTTLNSPGLAAAFSRYWAANGAPTSGTVNVPVKVSLSKGGQVLLTNLQVTPTGSKMRYVRVGTGAQGPAPLQSATVSFVVNNDVPNPGPLTVAADVGDDGTVDWTYTGSPTYPARLTTGNLAAAFNAYLSGRSGEVDVPIRFYAAPFLPLGLADFAATPSARPDATLTASDIAFGTANPTEGDTITINATIRNPGVLNTGPLTAAFYATPAGGMPWYIGSAFVPNIPAGGTAQAVIAWNTLGFTGTVPVRVVLDPFNRVAETNEENNQATANITIRTRPDLQVTGIALSDDEPMAGEMVTVTLTLRNHGQTTAGAQAVVLYQGNPNMGGTVVGAQGLAPLPGGNTTTVAFAWTPTAPGPYRLFARADRDNAVNEYDEGNNDTWRDVYVGLASPVLLDSGGSSDVAYDPARGYGYVTPGTVVIAYCGPDAEQTARSADVSRVEYRFDHLLPGHFYHVDITLYECDGTHRQERVLADGFEVASAVNLGDGRVHRLSLRLDPALYADRTVTVAIEEVQGNDAVVSVVALHDIDYRYADAGGANDPRHPSAAERPYGWLEGVIQTAWGTLPYQTRRIDLGDADPSDDPDNELRYRFDSLKRTARYKLLLSFFNRTTPDPVQRVTVDGVPVTAEFTVPFNTRLDKSVPIPPSAYVEDGSIVVGIVRTNAQVGGFVNEIALEEETLSQPTEGCNARITPYVSYAYGTAVIAGNPAPAGTLIQALNPRGEVVGCFVVQAAGYYGFMPIYGEDATASPPIPGMRDGETVRFRVGGQEATATPPFVWHNDRYVHEVALAVGAMQQQAISLKTGWNLFSFRLQPSSTAVRDVLQSINGQFDRLLGENGTFVPGLPDPFQSLLNLYPGKAHWIRITNPQGATLIISGIPVDPSTPIPLTRGWRWVGYLPQGTLPITVALQSIAGSYDMVYGTRGTYVPGLPDIFQTLLDLRPGEGYLIRMTRDATLVYPAGTLNVQTWERSNVSTFVCPSAQVTPHLTLAYGEVYMGGEPAPAGTVVEAVTLRGEVAGCFVVHAPGYFGLMHLYGRDTDGRTPGFLPDEAVAWRVNGVEAVAEPALVWKDDRQLHQVRLAADSAAMPYRLQLPRIVR